MTFTQSIKTCFCKYANFKGRASRSEFWWFSLFVFLFVWLPFGIFGPTNECNLADNCNKASFIFLALALLTILPFFAVAARRFQDSGRSATWRIALLIGMNLTVNQSDEPVLTLLIGMIVYIPLIVMWCLPSQPDANKYGSPPE